MIVIRREAVLDHGAIASVTREAFAQLEPSSQSESLIIDALRRAGALAVSLVAEVDGQVVGHVAFSPVAVEPAHGARRRGAVTGWYGLGPLSVLPSMQRQGIGSRLVREGLATLAALDARGCVVVGEPKYYRRFGFACDPALVAEGLPPEYFMCLLFGGDRPIGTVTYHRAFFAVE
jgi:putative acetyltransferase